jgi:hypothetical protein
MATKKIPLEREVESAETLEDLQVLLGSDDAIVQAVKRYFAKTESDRLYHKKAYLKRQLTVKRALSLLKERELRDAHAEQEANA